MGHCAAKSVSTRRSSAGTALAQGALMHVRIAICAATVAGLYALASAAPDSDSPSADSLVLLDDLEQHTIVDWAELMDAQLNQQTLAFPLAPELPKDGERIDTEHWIPEARTAFLDCLGLLEFSTEQDCIIVGFDQFGIPIMHCSGGQIPTPTDEQIRDCLESTKAEYGDVCLPATGEQCLSTAYFSTWCGQHEYQRHYADPSWLCTTELTNAWSPIENDPNADIQTRLLPAEMRGFFGPRFHDLDQAPMIVAQPPQGAYFSSNEFTALDDPGFLAERNSVAGRFPRAAPAGTPASRPSSMPVPGAVPTWLDATPSVGSCAEYAYKKYFDYKELLRLAEPTRNSARTIVDAVFPPGATSVPDIENRDGAALGDPSPTWLITEGDKLGREVFDNATLDLGRVTTYKNLYYYLEWIEDPTQRPGFTPVGSHTVWEVVALMQLRNRYDYDLDWHREMAETARQEGYTDELMDALQSAQVKLWELYESGAPRSEIIAALEFGRRHGCIPTDANTPTPCDWSPELLAKHINRTWGSWYSSAVAECVHEFGDATAAIAQADIESRFLDPVTVLPPNVLPNNPHVATATAVRNTALTRPYLASATEFRSIFTDLENYRTAMVDAMNFLADDPMRSSGEQGFAEGTGSMSSALKLFSSGGNTNTLDLCDSGIDIVNTTSWQASILGAKWDIANVETNFWSSSTAGVDAVASNSEASATELRGGGKVGGYVSARAGGRAIYEPGVQAGGGINVTPLDYSVGISMGVGATIPIGVFSIRLDAGAEARAGLALAVDFQLAVPLNTVCDPLDNIAWDLTVSATPYGSAGAFVSAGVGVGPISIGVKGSVTLLDLRFPVEYVVAQQTPGGNPQNAAWNELQRTENLTVSREWTRLRGSISIVLQLSVGISINLLEWVLIEFTRHYESEVLVNRTSQDQPICKQNELRSIFPTMRNVGGTTQVPEGCRCVLRPQAACGGGQ